MWALTNAIRPLKKYCIANGKLDMSIGEGTIKSGNGVCYNRNDHCLAVNVITSILCVKPDGSHHREIELPHKCSSRAIDYCMDKNMYVVAEPPQGRILYVVNEDILGSFKKSDKSSAEKGFIGLAVAGGAAAVSAIGIAFASAVFAVAVPVMVGAGIAGGAGGMATVTGTVGAVLTLIASIDGKKEAMKKQIPATVKDITDPTYIYHESRDGQECRIWVVDRGNNMVGGYTNTAESVGYLGAGLIEDTLISSLDSVCVDNSGRFVMCDSIGKRVMRCHVVDEKEQWDVILSPDQLNGSPVSAVITPDDQIIIGVPTVVETVNSSVTIMPS